MAFFVLKEESHILRRVDLSAEEMVKVTEKTMFAFDTEISLRIYGNKGEDVIARLEEKIVEFNELLSPGKANSEISRLNESGRAVLSKISAELVKKSLEYNIKTGGIFDITTYSLMEKAGFTSKNYKVLSDEEIKEALENVGYDKIFFNEATREISFATEGVKIGFGAIGKGYITDELVKLLRQEGVKSAIINLGGNVFALNKKPDGSLWSIALRDAENPARYMAAVMLEDEAIITSGGYERYFEKDGKRYHHILDTRTGKPSTSNLKSVSIISRDGTLADVLATTFFIMGEQAALDYWRNSEDDFEIIFLTEDNRLLVSEKVKDRVFSDIYKIEQVNRYLSFRILSTSHS